MRAGQRTRKSRNCHIGDGFLQRSKTMMRDKLSNEMKDAMKAKDSRRLSTVRLIQTAIKDRDIANRGAGKDPVSDEEIMQVLQKMVKQREESAKIYDEAGRAELAAQEREEINVIKSFMPEQLPEDKVRQLCQSVVSETGAHGLRDMGKCMNALKERYPGQMDFAKASGVVKELLK
jgi:uncharacterized protein YqeY